MLHKTTVKCDQIGLLFLINPRHGGSGLRMLGIVNGKGEGFIARQ